MRFCCKHCDQAYYGTSEHGHLVPKSFTCVNCQNAVTMDEMIVRPMPGMEEKTYAVIESLPWLKRREQNWIACWWKTIWRGMVTPSTLVRGLPINARAGEGWWFAVMNFLFIFLLGIFAPFAALVIIDAASGGSGANSGGILLFAIGMPIGGVAATLLLLLLWGLTTHGMLRITGGCEYGIGKTFQAQCYTMGPCIFMAVPCIGFYCIEYISLVWWVVVACIALAAVQKVNAGRAVLATLVLPVLLIVSIGVLYFGLIFGGMFMGGWAGPGFAANQAMVYSAGESDAQSVATGLQSYVAQNQKYPDHAAQLIGSQLLSPMSFAGYSTDTFIDTIPLGEATLDDYGVSSFREQQRMIDAAVALLPDNVVAHRFGDFVFTYHGIDSQSPPAGLWLFVGIEDPEVNDSSMAIDPVFISRSDYMVESIPRDDLPVAIEQQNELRANYGLAPLPTDLLEVTHDNPLTTPE